MCSVRRTQRAEWMWLCRAVEGVFLMCLGLEAPHDFSACKTLFLLQPSNFLCFSCSCSLCPRHPLPPGSALHFLLLHSLHSHLLFLFSDLPHPLFSAPPTPPPSLSIFSTSALPSICFILLSHLSSFCSISLIIFWLPVQLCSFLSPFPLPWPLLSPHSLSLSSHSAFSSSSCFCATLEENGLEMEKVGGSEGGRECSFCFEAVFHNEVTKNVRSSLSFSSFSDLLFSSHLLNSRAMDTLARSFRKFALTQKTVWLVTEKAL